MKQTIYNINNLIKIIKDYSLNLHKTTFRYGIDYIKCEPYLKEKYPEVFKELEEYFVPRKVTFIYKSISNSIYPISQMIEIGNKYELETMVGVPKATLIPLDENHPEYDSNITQIIIEDLQWVPLENLSEIEINEYRNKLKLLINVVNYDWLNEPKLNNLLKILNIESNTDIFISNLKTNKYNDIITSVIDLTLEDRLILADKFNSEIRKDCLNTIRDNHLDLQLVEIERHNWLDTLGVIPNQILNIIYNDFKYEIYI